MMGNYSKPDPCFLVHGCAANKIGPSQHSSENTGKHFSIDAIRFYCISLPNLIALIFVMDRTTQFELVLSEGRH